MLREAFDSSVPLNFGIVVANENLLLYSSFPTILHSKDKMMVKIID